MGFCCSGKRIELIIFIVLRKFSIVNFVMLNLKTKKMLFFFLLFYKRLVHVAKAYDIINDV